VTVLTAEAIQSAGIKIWMMSRRGAVAPVRGGIRPGAQHLDPVYGGAGWRCSCLTHRRWRSDPILELFNQDFLDVSDIELLRGPQGALYGRVHRRALYQHEAATNAARDDANFSFASAAMCGCPTLWMVRYCPIKSGATTVGYQNRRDRSRMCFWTRHGFVHATTFVPSVRQAR